MPTSFGGAAGFVFGFWLALQLLLPLVTPRPAPAHGSVLEGAHFEAAERPLDPLGRQN
jgi:hypothetical protein